MRAYPQFTGLPSIVWDLDEADRELQKIEHLTMADIRLGAKQVRRYHGKRAA